MKKRGYLLYCIKTGIDHYAVKEKVKKSDPTEIVLPEVKPSRKPEVLPDIILILNETLFDLEEYVSLNADRDYFAAFDQIDHLRRGRALVYGGTNNAEFELLTMNSICLVKEHPFNYMDFSKQSPATAISYFNDLGYYTSGMHWCCATNYCRGVAFKSLGFQDRLLGEEAFSYHSFNGNRSHLDSDDYKQLIDQYEKHKDKPQFIYALTYQNHGGYSRNEDAMDTVHTGNDFGPLTGEVNEYLSSVTLSADAFQELTEYFQKSDHPVVICMVGDHAPSFISQLPSDRFQTDIEVELQKRLVPFFLWSNYEIERSTEFEYASMPDLIPMILKLTGLPLSPWHQQILNLHQVAPVREKKYYMDHHGTVCRYANSRAAQSEWDNYLKMACNNIRGGSGFRKDVFACFEESESSILECIPENQVGNNDAE